MSETRKRQLRGPIHRWEANGSAVSIHDPHITCKFCGATLLVIGSTANGVVIYRYERGLIRKQVHDGRTGEMPTCVRSKMYSSAGLAAAS